MNPNNNCFNYCLMPSEIARLVYGYCLETGCTKSAKYLLEESPYLKEFAQGIKNGYPFSTKINNQSLLQVLNGQWHGPMFGSNNNFNSNNVSMQAEYHDFKDDKITSDQYSTPKHKILYSMNSGNNYSPRRKNATPKRLANNTSINHQHHYNQQQHQRSHQLQPESQQSKQYGILSQHSYDNSQIFSSPLSSNESEAQIEVQPKIIFDELLKCGPLHDKVANTIQKLIHANQDDNSNQLNSIIDNNDNEISEKSDLNTANNENNVANKHGTIEKDSIPSLDEILDSLTEEPAFNDFVDMVVEKEIANTPFKRFQTPNSCSSACSNNLNTPHVAWPSNDSKNYDPKQMPVKNIMKEMEEQQQYQQQKNNQPDADDTMMDCEYLRKISPTNQSNDIKFSRQKENLKISNSQQRIVNSSQNFIRSRPIVSNADGRVFVPKYTRLSRNQQKVQQALNIAPIINVNNVTSNSTTQTEPNKPLTTTIEVVPGDNNTAKSESELGSNVENVIAQQRINTGIDVLSSPVSWPSNTITTQPIILPSNQLAWDNENGLLYLSYPSDDTIYYIDPQQISTSTIATINDNFVNTTPSTSQNIQIRTNQQEESVASSTATETFSSQQDVDDDVKMIENNVESKQQQQSPKISRPIPSILSKGKQKKSSNILSEALKLLADDDNLVKDNRQINNNSSQTKKCDDNHKLRRKLESSQMSRSENPKKKKIDHEEMRKRRNSLDTSDDKIKTILRSDIEKFLVDIHKDENEK